MRGIYDHHDGHGLNESIEITADPIDPNAGGASHRYVASIGGVAVATIQFQHGARKETASIPGITEAALLAIVADRVRCFNAGPFPCRENALVLTKVQEAIHWTRHRADERAKRGVLGKNEK